MRLRPLITALCCAGMLQGVARAASPWPDASDELRRLASSRALDRESAQRWLAVHLQPADQRLLADFARDGDAETRRRLVRALSGADRHLELILLLCDDTGQPARNLGREALTELVLAWVPGLADQPFSVDEVMESKAESAAQIYALDARHETLAERLERIARFTDLTVPLVMTPELIAEDVATLRPALVGTALELLTAMVQSGGLSLAGVGRSEDERGPAVLVFDRRGRARQESGFQRIEKWCLDVRRAGPESRAASLALASSGWPAALAWLESRALQSSSVKGREAALEGLLAAARQGLVSPGLTRIDTRRMLIERGDAWLAAADAADQRRGAGVARALAELGPRDPDGEDCGALLLENWPLNAPETVHWLRLVALEGQRSSDARLSARAAAIAAESAYSPSLRIQALRALAASGGERVQLTDAPALQRLRTHAAARGGEGELLDLLGAVALPPGPLLYAAANRSADPRTAPFIASWALYTGDETAAVGLMRDAALKGIADEAQFELWLEVARDARRLSGAESARRFVDESLELDETSLARDLIARAALATPEEQKEWAQALAARDELRGRDLLTLGALAAGPSSSTVKDRLILELERKQLVDARGLHRACDLAADVLRAARRDLELKLLQREVWRAVRAPAHPLHDSLGPDRYPNQVRIAANRLGAFVRRLGD